MMMAFHNRGNVFATYFAALLTAFFIFVSAEILWLNLLSTESSLTYTRQPPVATQSVQVFTHVDSSTDKNILTSNDNNYTNHEKKQPSAVIKTINRESDTPHNLVRSLGQAVSASYPEGKCLTSAKYSHYWLVNKEPSRGFIKVQIQARDCLNRTRTHGGDLWSIKVTSTFSPDVSMRTSAQVVDRQNGSYTASLFVGCSRRLVIINVTLIHPSKAVQFLKELLGDSKHHQIFWNATASTDDGTRTTYTLCYMTYNWASMSPSLKNKCLYPHSKALGDVAAWTCDKPPGMQCDDIRNYTGGSVTSEVPLRYEGQREFLRKRQNNMWLFKGQNVYQKVSNGPPTIQIPGNFGPERNNSKSQNPTHQMCAVEKLPSCKPSLTYRSSNKGSTGYWRNNTWMSTICQTRSWEYWKRKWISCFQDKQLFFLGDSTTRQWVERLTKQYRNVSSPEEANKEINGSRHSIKFDSKKYNFNVTFQFHPQYTSRGVITPIDTQKYEVDIIDRLPQDQCNYIVVVSPWAHFTRWWSEAYSERLRRIRDSVERLQQRCPVVKVVVKGPHPTCARQYENNVYELMSNSDFKYLKMQEQMKTIFRDSGAYFLDSWDLNLSYGDTTEIHMPPNVIEQELAMFFSFICKLFK